MKNQNKEEINLYHYEEELYDSGYKNVCGIDEAGRGPLAGPVVVAACIMPPFLRIEGINDSKQLSEKKREELYKIIVKEALAYSIVFINEKDIDELNILNATKKGMLKCLEELKVNPDYVLIDAVDLGELKIESKAIVHGDALSASIAAASILAKVSRDHYMEAMDKKYPNYGFARHKGYGTKAHLEALEKYGPCAIHRKTFTPVNKYFSKQLSLDLDIEDKNED
ncbi:MAG: ribonuclease HII [Acholeplasmatales bacterium]|nr:ribonuclease HII [Acholeplasmatales bacterium]